MYINMIVLAGFAHINSIRALMTVVQNFIMNIYDYFTHGPSSNIESLPLESFIDNSEKIIFRLKTA